MTSRKTAIAVRTEEIITLPIGRRMEDGSLYAGISPDNGRDMFVTPADAGLTPTFNQADDYARTLNVCGHRDWRMPSKGELKVMFDNLASIGGFDRDKWYWSATQETNFSAWAQHFGDGRQRQMGEDMKFALRCIRG